MISFHFCELLISDRFVMATHPFRADNLLADVRQSIGFSGVRAVENSLTPRAVCDLLAAPRGPAPELRIFSELLFSAVGGHNFIGCPFSCDVEGDFLSIIIDHCVCRGHVVVPWLVGRCPVGIKWR